MTVIEIPVDRAIVTMDETSDEYANVPDLLEDELGVNVERVSLSLGPAEDCVTIDFWVGHKSASMGVPLNGQATALLWSFAAEYYIRKIVLFGPVVLTMSDNKSGEVHGLTDEVYEDVYNWFRLDLP